MALQQLFTTFTKRNINLFYSKPRKYKETNGLYLAL